jgi:hypothetical protein
LPPDEEEEDDDCDDVDEDEDDVVWRRKLNLKATFESGSSHLSFKL